MRYWALDLLACLSCKSYPLNLIVFNKEIEDIDTTNVPKPYCKNYCGYLKEDIKEGKEYPCEECLKHEITEGILYCSKCLHWYPIKKGIVIMLPDGRRRKESDLEFLKKYHDRIPENILKNGKPFNLSNED